MNKYILFILLLIGLISTTNAYNENNSKLTANALSKREPKAKSIQLTAPNGGEIWQAGSTQLIKWTSSEITFVNISYSTNNGINWTSIANHVEASLWQYYWNIPKNITPSQEFRIRVVDESDALFSDMSDNKFILTKLNLLSPTSSISFQTGRVDTIKWVASSDIASVDIDISINDGAWQTVIHNYDASLGQYEYSVPNNASANNRIRIRNSAILSTQTISDYFRIATLDLNSPNGGEVWFQGTNQTISWNSNSITNLGIAYSIDNSLTWTIIEDPYSAAFNSYSFQVPSVASNQALIKVYDADEPEIFDVSNTVFTIYTLTVTSPNANTGWEIGSTKNITWSSNLTGNVKIEITTNNGTNWSQIATGISASLGVYSYVIPNTPTARGKIRITSTTNAAYSAVSDGLFTIGNINITRPSGGEVFRAGDVESILWTSTAGINLIKIEYSTDGINWNLITANAQASLGRYDWAIPSNLASSTGYIRLSDSESDSGLRFETSSFTITNIVITSPTGNEIYKGGTAQNITWVASPNISNVNIEFRRDDSLPWQTIATSVAANLGTYTWNIPDTLSTAYGKIRISSSSNINIESTSDGYFKVGNIRINTPNGGEKLVGNGNYNVTWTSTSSVSYLRMQYSLDGGLTFINVPNASSYPASAGSFTWQVPNILSNNVLFRISDSDGPVIFDVSDNTFSIAELGLTYPNGGEGFVPGTPVTITWSSTNITSINLDYQVNNGIWNNIVTNINAALGSYNWTIPNTPSAQVNIRISANENTELFDITDGVFKIGSIQVLSSNGGEVVQVGEDSQIEWNYTNGINSVNIDLTTNNGVSWINLVTNYPSTGTYNWSVTNAASNTAKLRISDADNPTIYDISDNDFSIRNLILNYPNGGNFFLVDSVVAVTWQQFSVANVRLEYSTDNGLFWNTIVNSVPSVPSLYNWTIPNMPSNRVLVRISDADFQPNYISDVSDANFSINMVYVISPDGGESYVVNSLQNVKWKVHNSVNNLRLEYTTNNGTSWSIVENSIPAATLNYNWTIPNTPTSQARIRLIDVDNSAVLDESNNMFAIGSILLTSPDGFERWKVGSTHSITWNNISTVPNVDIDYSTDNGLTWINIAANYDATLENYDWVIPNTVTSFALVRVRSSSNQDLFDISNNNFSIVSLNVTSPNGGEVLQVGNNLAITWDVNNITYVNIDYSVDNGNTWNRIGYDVLASDEIFNYTLPDIPTSTGLIRIVDSQDNSIFDVSNADFRVLRLYLNSPNGGESYKIGMSRNITWNSSGITNLDIFYSLDNGVNWNTVSLNNAASTGFYNWLLPNIPSNTVKIKILDHDNPSIQDSSDNYFTVGTISVLEPILSEILKANTIKQIKWTATPGIENVKIEFRLNNSSSWEVIEPSATAQVGTYNWLVSNNASNQAKIRISDAVNGTFIIDSSAQFTINTINLVSPNGGEYWQSGTTKTIRWTSSLTGNVKLSYSLDNGASWNTIAASVPAITNSYNWLIPNGLSSNQVIVKINDVITPAVQDSSDGVFRVGDIAITNILGGENWQTITQKLINFSTSNSINEVNIEYTLDNIVWNSIVSNYPASSGSYLWNIGDINPSSTARIRISDSESSLGIVDVSNTFNLIQLKVTSPNGNELWQNGQTNLIQWVSSSHVPNVNIYYSLDNGSNWVLIHGNYPSVSNNVNSYSWLVPNTLLSQQTLIRIESVANNLIVDNSDDNFSIGNLAITSPINNSEYQSGKKVNITWNSTNIGNVRLEYSLDNGNTWTTIINSLSSDLHSYNWTVDNNISSHQARVRITALNNVLITSISDPFIIKLLQLTTPDGGEQWQGGSVKAIIWNSSEINSLSLYSSIDNGATWVLISNNINASAGTYNWLVPENIATTNAKIRLIDEDNNTVRDSSSYAFTINSLNLSSPLGGEEYQAGTPINISWTGINLGLLQIDYSLNNGTDWIKIIDNINGDIRSYNWNIPSDTASNTAKIRIRELADTTNEDISPVFTINRLQVYSPNGSENWQAGSTKQIVWYSKYINSVSVAYSLDNGTNWTNIAENVAGNTYSLNWDIPSNISSTNARIKVWDTNNSSFKDSSDLTFTISNIGITAPTLNSHILAGYTTKITWNSSNMGMIGISYSIDNGNTWNIIANNVNSAVNQYNWSVPTNAASDQALIRLQSLNDPLIYITSGLFTISSIEIVSPNGGEVWQAGSTHNISWNSQYVNNVNLKYSLNNGTTWNTIVENIPSIPATLSWTLPQNISSMNSIVKIEDAMYSNIVDSSNTAFTIADLKITSPILNEQIQAGQNKNITWTSSNIGLINIEFSIDNGTTWNSISNNVSANQQSYQWIVPNNVTSNQALVRLSSVLDPTILSISPIFIISSITVTSPNGGEIMQAGTSTNITWNSQYINNISIDYSIDNGTNWLSVVENIPSNTGSYNWITPNDISSSTTLIRVKDHNNNNVYDISDNTFTLSRIVITAPISGAQLQTDRETTIRWEAGNIGNILIEYSIDNGTSWNTIANNINSSLLNYKWVVPSNVATSQGLIRISSIAIPTILSTSELFKISTLELISPNGGERWQANTTENITWNSLQVSNVNLYYSIDNGINYSLIAANIAAAAGTYSWVIPANVTTTDGRIKIIDAGNSAIQDSNDNKFTIGSLGIFSPAGNEEWQAGKQYTITWNANTTNSSLRIEYSNDGGTSWNIIENSYPTASNNYLWTVPANEGTATARVRITDNSKNLTYQSNLFTIKQLEITQPLGGENWNSGTTQNITWNSSQIINVKIEYTTNNGNTWNPIVNSINAVPATYAWTIPADLGNNNVKLKITDASNSLINDSMAVSLKIGSVVVVSPNGGEILQAGTTYKIRWINTSNIFDVSIEFSEDNGATWNYLTNSTQADGEYDWNIPNTIATTNGLIRITDNNSSGLIIDQSNSVFTINNLNLLTPNGFENLTVGNVYPITWSASNNIALVTLEYYNENSGWKQIATNINANLGTYSWTIPNDPSDSVKVRIKNVANSQVYDISENIFRIASVGLTNPNTNLRWQAGTYKNIQWINSPNVKNINIDYSIDAGTTWKNIVMNLSSNSGTYKWLVPEDSSLTARIRITDVASGGNIFDVNDQNFIINILKISQPDGTDAWLSGSSQTITWLSTQDIDSVSINLSVDGGNSWSIINKVKANKGSYNWTIPQLMSSTNAYILIKDTKFETIRDTSNRFGFLPGNLSLISPNGGEYLNAGAKYYINWNASSEIQNVKLEYKLKTDTTWTIIANSYPADSLRYLWNIPNGISSNNAKVRVSDALNSFISDSSANVFKIGWIVVDSPNGGEQIQSGRTVAINWNNSSNIQNVKIEYTVDEINYSTIIPSVSANIGTYNWTIPNTPSTNVKIRISDVVSNNSIIDYCDNVFTISLLQLTTPSSAIQLQAGRVYQIKWNSSPDINYVNLEYTLDGTVWNLLNQDSIQASLGLYNWQIPDNLCSTNGKIRIWNNSTASINDTSRYPITFKVLNIVAPTGGENWQVGTTKSIRWNACQVDTITIEYSVNGGQNWILVADNIPTSQNLYNWIIPNTISNNTLVRLIDKTNPQLYTVSSAFSIFNPSLDLLSPNGGEIYRAGSSKNIIWQSNLVDYVKVEFSSDSGATWNTLTSSFPTDSVYTWNIPNGIETFGAVIKISDVLNPHIKDTSEVFTITTLRLTSPMGGEYWQAGTNQNITWLAGPGINLVRLQYSLDNGANWTNIAEAQNITASVDTFKWQIPITVGTNLAKVRVLDVVDPALYSTSPDTFTIGWTRVLSPNGGNVYQSGLPIPIRWDCSSNLRKLNVEIINSNTNQVVVETEVNAALKLINLIVPANYYSDSLLVRLSEVNSNYLISDLSDNMFSSKGLELIRPSIGDNWKSGSTEIIRWEASSNNSTLNIEYSSNNGATWNTIAHSIAANLQQYSWQIPNNLSSDSCIVKIYNTLYNNVKDSSGLFNIFVPGISVVSPNGNNYLQAGKSYKIKWSSSFVTSVAIEYSLDNGANWDTLKAPVAASLKELTWDVPTRISTTQGLIRISDYGNSSVKDVSDDTFVIGWIDIDSPDGGENWMSNSSHPITWANSPSVSLVNIYYNNGIDTNWVMLANNYPTSSMPFNWTQIPNNETNRGKIRIVDAKSNGEISNISVDYFSITKLYVLSPNGGEVYYSGMTYPITWSPSMNINAVKIELSTNGGKNWAYNLTSSTPASSGKFNWTVDGALFSDSCLIRVTDVENTTILDISDNYFTVGAIQLRTFETEEKVLEGSTKSILWLNSGNISYVDLLYRTKNKIWKPIKLRVPASSGRYDWTIPSEPSDSCFIAIRNSENYIFSDTSNTPFTIARLKLASPNGMEVWQTGTTKEFTWQSSYVTQIYIEYTTDTTIVPISWNRIAIQPILASLGKYEWTIPDDINLAGKNYRFRIYDISEVKVADTSNGYSTLSYLRVLAPNNGEQIGTAYTIKWSNSINTIPKVNIYVQNEISDYNWQLVASGVSSNPSNYNWSINVPASQTCRIKIEDSANNSIYDISDAPFTISTIKLISPNGGNYQKLQVGKTYDITWETSFINLVRLEFSTNHGITWNVLPNATALPASEKKFAWYVDDITSRNMKIRISNAENSNIFDVSDTTFNVCSLNLVQPNTLTALQVGINYSITWKSENLDSVRIQLSIDDGKSWNYQIGVIDADSGKFNWKVPNVLSALARIRISDYYEASVNDTSNSNFVIGKFPNVAAVKKYQSNIIKFLYDFLTPQETINIEKFEYQIGEGAVINSIHSLINPPASITGPQTDTLYWRSSDNLSNYEGVIKVWVTFRSPQYNVEYKVQLDSVGVDNKPPEFDKNSVVLYQKPNKFGWSNVITKWDIGTDLSNVVYYKLNFNDINNEYINFTKSVKDDSLIIPNVWTSVDYFVKLDVYDIYNNTTSYILPNYKSLAACDFSGDNELNAVDLATFVKSWSTKDSTLGADLAPYDGNFPNIKIKGNGKLDIEDLLVFVNMWNYGQEFVLPKLNKSFQQIQEHESQTITFKKGENKFNLPIFFDKKLDLLAVTAEINYKPSIFKFDSLLVKGLSQNGLSFSKIDTAKGIIKIDFAELYSSLNSDYSISSIINCNLDRFSNEDSISVNYIGYNNSLQKVLDKTVVFTMHEVPASYKLYQNYPNPFNPSTTIEYDLPEKTKVTLVIFDILGREIATLVNEEQNIGFYKYIFNANSFGKGLASGVYFYRLHTNHYTLTQKMLLIK